MSKITLFVEFDNPAELEYPSYEDIMDNYVAPVKEALAGYEINADVIIPTWKKVVI